MNRLRYDPPLIVLILLFGCILFGYLVLVDSGWTVSEDEAREQFVKYGPRCGRIFPTGTAEFNECVVREAEYCCWGRSWVRSSIPKEYRVRSIRPEEVSEMNLEELKSFAAEADKRGDYEAANKAFDMIEQFGTNPNKK